MSQLDKRWRSPENNGPEQKFALLMKFGQREHLERFRNDGELYMNSESYFAKCEGDTQRGDRCEGTDRIAQPHDVTNLTISSSAGHIVLGPADLVGPVRLGLGCRPRLNLFCMFSITDTNASPLVSPENQSFGDSFVLILNTQAFLDQFSSAAGVAGLGVDAGQVEYYDPETYTGDTGPFRKPTRFEHQHEFRLVVWPGCDNARRLIVGSLRAIASEVLPLAKVSDLIRFG